MGSPRSNPESLHVALYLGLYSHLIAFCEERGRHELDVEMRLDNVDSPSARDFESAAKNLLNLDARVKRVTGFDPGAKAVTGEIRSKIVLPEELSVSVVLRSLTLNLVNDQDPLVLAADVLANSLTNLFHAREANEKFGPLNRPEAVVTHPLAVQLDAFWNWGGGDLVGDAIYRLKWTPILGPMV